MRAFFLLITIILALCVGAFGQSLSATVTGVVTDSTGGSVPDAEVIIRGESQDFTRRATSNESGFFNLPNLPAGTYSLTVTAAGFKQYSQARIELLLNQQVRVEARLEVGNVTETVTVSESVSPINYTDAVRQEGVSGLELNQLPLVVSGGPRSAANFTVLLPGVTTGGGNNAFDARINGGMQTGQEAIMDGVSMQQGTMSQSGMISFFDFRMTPDMVREFKVLTSNYEPQYGASTSAQMIVETKSGSDQFHGGVFEYLRNEKLNARQFGAATRPVSKEHNFGGFIGGPVKIPIPGVFKGNSRTYFYTDIEAFRATGGNVSPTLSVPTMAMRQGDFSDWRTADGAQIPIFDPSTTSPNSSFNPNQAEGPGNLRFLRTQFANNRIPAAIVQNSLAQAWIPFIPEPNRPGSLNNYQVPRPIPDGILANTNYFMARIDNHQGDKHHFYFTLWRQIAPVKFNSLLPEEISNQSFSDPQNSWVNRFNWIYTISPTLINQWNIGYLNRNEGYGAISYRFLDQFPKIPGVADANTPPTINFSDGYESFGSNAGPNDGNLTTRPTWITNNLTTWVKGDHTIKFGLEYRFLSQDFNTNTNTAGTFSFNRLNTGLVGLTNSGHPFASFLLGTVSSADAEFRTVNSWGARAHGFVLHVGDTWRVNRKLSVNYGLRWDVFTPAYEKNDQFSFFDPNGVNPSAGSLKGRLAFAGDGYGEASYGSRYPEEVWKKGFAPRLGIAYTLNPKTVVRSGYGVFFTQNYYPGWGGGMNLDGFNQTASFSSTLGGMEPAFILANGFPQNFEKPPFIDGGFRNGRGTLYRPIEANRRPYSQQWNLTVERELPASVLLSVAYVGNKGTRLPSAIVPLNALDPGLLNSPVGPILLEEIPAGVSSYKGVNVPYGNWSQQLRDAGCAPTVAQALLPFPQYCSNLLGLNENAGNSTYHALQTKLEKRFSQGLYMLVSYTWSKLITDVQGTNPDANTGSGAVGVISPFERQRNKSLAQDDVPHILSASFVYDLPFGRGKTFGSESGFVNALLGGWQVNGIFKINAGTPLFFRANDACNVIPGQFRLGCIPGVLPGKSALLQDMNNIDVNRPIFDSSAFEPVGVVNGNYYYGSGSRITSLRGPRFANTDFSVVRFFPFTAFDRQFQFQIRGEFFNLWNEHHFTTSAGQGDGGAFERDLSSPAFGTWTGAVTSPRNVQLTARFTF